MERFERFKTIEEWKIYVDDLKLALERANNLLPLWHTFYWKFYKAMQNDFIITRQVDGRSSDKILGSKTINIYDELIKEFSELPKDDYKKVISDMEEHDSFCVEKFGIDKIKKDLYEDLRD